MLYYSCTEELRCYGDYVLSILDKNKTLLSYIYILDPLFVEVLTL